MWVLLAKLTVLTVISLIPYLSRVIQHLTTDFDLLILLNQTNHVIPSPQLVNFLFQRSLTKNKCPRFNTNMRTQQKTKELGVAFRNDGCPLFEQLAMVEEATRKGRVESLLTQINEEEEDDQSQTSKENSSVYSVKSEEGTPNPKKSSIRLFFWKQDIDSSSLSEYSMEKEQIENSSSSCKNIEENSSNSCSQ